MAKIERILVPTDFSEESEYGLAMAASIAQKMQADIYLLHVIDIPMPTGIKEVDITHLDLMGETDLADPEKIYLMKLLKETKGKINTLKAKFPQASIFDYVSFDRITHQIHHLVEKQAIDLIVMGSKGTSNNQSMLLGSNAEKVIRTAKVPVITVKQAPQEVNFQHICFASDFGNVPEFSVRMLKMLQENYSTTIHLLKIITPNNFELSSITRKAMKTFAEKHHLENYTINFYNYYTEYEGILSFAEEIHADLISMTTQGNTGFIRVLMGSIAEDVANHSALPVMTFNETK